MDITNPYAPPRSEVDPGPGSGGAWRQGKRLVMPRGAALPGRCIYCNDETHYRKKRRLLYLNIWLRILAIMLFVVFNVLALLPILIIVLVFRKSASIEVPICPAHRQRRLIMTTVTVALMLVSALLFFAAVNDYGISQPVWILSAGIFVVAFAIAIVRGQLLRAWKIESRNLFLNGAGPAFLDSLPEYDGS